jgi:hypothetical protein
MRWFDGREKRTAVNAAICPNRVEYKQKQRSLEVVGCTVSAQIPYHYFGRLIQAACSHISICASAGIAAAAFERRARRWRDGRPVLKIRDERRSANSTRQNGDLKRFTEDAARQRCIGNGFAMPPSQ